MTDDTTGEEAVEETGESTGEDDSTAAQPSNDGQRFDQLPATAEDRAVPGRATREEVIDWWNDRFGIPRDVFAEYTFWEKGAGKIWIFNGEAPNPAEVEAVGMTFLRTRQEHWKPTTRAVQRFGHHATTELIELSGEETVRFARGEDQEIDRWEGDWGYLVVAHELAGGLEPIGVGLYVYGELRSLVPKGSQEELGLVD